jgi:hypothetical protein
MRHARARIIVVLLLGLLTTGVLADYWSDHGCVLDKPKAVFRKGGFKLNEETGQATETIMLGESISVRLEQTACEYLSRTYTFTLGKPPSDTEYVGWQYRKAIELLTKLEENSGPKLNFTREKKALHDYEQLVAIPNEDVDINTLRPQQDISEFISLRSRIGEKGTKIIVKMWSGPY